LSIRSSEGSEAERAEFGLRQGLADGGGRIVDRGAEEIVVTIRAGVKPLRNSDLAGLSSCRARASVRAVDARTGRVLAQLTQEASAVDLSSEGAAAKAAEKAGQAAGRALARRLGDALAGR
jgi:hypothetical protein